VNTFTKGAAAALIVATMAGCGTQGLAGNTAKVPDATFEALSASGLKKAFTRVHKAIFASMDVDKNGWLDEYEVGKHMTMSEFRKADRNDGWGSAGKLSQTEFVDYATSTFLWFNQDKDSFANSFRQALAKAFNRLDSNDDGLLKKTELSLRDLQKLGLTFEYPKLRIRVKISKVTEDQIKAADKTGDGQLSQAEFEDLYVEMVVNALGGAAPAPGPAPTPSEAPPAPAPAPPAPPAPPAL